MQCRRGQGERTRAPMQAVNALAASAAFDAEQQSMETHSRSTLRWAEPMRAGHTPVCLSASASKARVQCCLLEAHCIIHTSNLCDLVWHGPTFTATLAGCEITPVKYMLGLG